MKCNLVVKKGTKVDVGYECSMLDKLDGKGNPILKKYVVVKVYELLKDLGLWEEWSVEVMAEDGSLRYV